jgi:methyl-accepting chemotaxis protein
LEDLAYQVISNLVKYTKSVQGGLFIINDEDPNNKYIELVAAYAYDRRKFLEKRIPYGVGLLGRAVAEGETIYISNVPPDYLSISSGLGDRHPSALLIVPFKFNEIIYAVVELAAFEDYRAHVRRFVERIGVSVASTIANFSITQRTRQLVEQLRARSQELAAQEEEMRQNLEEMRATQEELRKKAQELENVVEALNKIAYVIELNPDGYILNINDRMLRLLKKRKDEILGKHYLSVIPEIGDQSQFDKVLDELKQGQMRLIRAHLLIGSSDFYLNMAYVPIMVEDKLQKIIVIGTDITQFVKSQNQ